MSNPREAALMKTESYRQQIAQWIFEGIQTYQRSQELPAETARLKLAANSGGQAATTVTATNLPAPKLEEVPDFRPKITAPNAVTATSLVSPPAPTRVVTATAEVPDFRPKTNITASAHPAPTKTPTSSAIKEPEVGKAEAAEPEVRKAIPVQPRKGE